MCCVYSCIVLEYMGCGDDLLDYLSYVCEIDGGSYDRTYSGRAKRKEKMYTSHAARKRAVQRIRKCVLGPAVQLLRDCLAGCAGGQEGRALRTCTCLVAGRMPRGAAFLPP